MYFKFPSFPRGVGQRQHEVPNISPHLGQKLDSKSLQSHQIAPLQPGVPRVGEADDTRIRAVGKFFENLGVLCPSKPIRAPSLKFVHNCETSVGSGCSAKKSSNLHTKIGVSGLTTLLL